jgi:hypothetical protein
MDLSVPVFHGRNIMNEIVTVELSGDLARRARAMAAQVNRPFEEMLVHWIDQAVSEPAVELLPDDQVLFLCDLQLSPDQQEELSKLLNCQREGQLTDAERPRLDELMRIYRHGMIRKAQALQTAVARGLKPRLN